MLRLKYCNLNFCLNLPGFLLGIPLGNEGLFESAGSKNKKCFEFYRSKWDASKHTPQLIKHHIIIIIRRFPPMARGSYSMRFLRSAEYVRATRSIEAGRLSQWTVRQAKASASLPNAVRSSCCACEVTKIQSILIHIIKLEFAWTL